MSDSISRLSTVVAVLALGSLDFSLELLAALGSPFQNFQLCLARTESSFGLFHRTLDSPDESLLPDRALNPQAHLLHPLVVLFGCLTAEEWIWFAG